MFLRDTKKIMISISISNIIGVIFNFIYDTLFLFRFEKNTKKLNCSFSFFNKIQTIPSKIVFLPKIFLFYYYCFFVYLTRSISFFSSFFCLFVIIVVLDVIKYFVFFPPHNLCPAVYLLQVLRSIFF